MSVFYLPYRDLRTAFIAPEPRAMTPAAKREIEIIRSIYRAAAAATAAVVAFEAMPATARYARAIPVVGVPMLIGEVLTIAVAPAVFANELAYVVQTLGTDEFVDPRSRREVEEALDKIASPIETIVVRVMKHLSPEAENYRQLTAAFESFKRAYNDRHGAKTPLAFINAVREEVESYLKIKEVLDKAVSPGQAQAPTAPTPPLVPPLASQPERREPRPRDYRDPSTWERGPDLVAPPPRPKPGPVYA